MFRKISVYQRYFDASDSDQLKITGLTGIWGNQIYITFSNNIGYT